MSEQEVLTVRSKLPPPTERTPSWLQTIPLEIGLMTEQGYPHQGHLDYVSPQLDASTGTIMMRGLFANEDRNLLPGFFARVRVPTEFKENAALVVPDRVLAEDQAGRYLLVVNKDDIVEQRRVTIGALLVGGLRVIASGLKPDDRVVVSTNGQAIPGRKVAPKATTIQAPTTQAPTAKAPAK